MNLDHDLNSKLRFSLGRSGDEATFVAFGTPATTHICSHPTASKVPRQLAITGQPLNAPNLVAPQLQALKVRQAIQVLNLGYLVAGEAQLPQRGQVPAVEGWDGAEVVAAQGETGERREVVERGRWDLREEVETNMNLLWCKKKERKKASQFFSKTLGFPV